MAGVAAWLTVGSLTQLRRGARPASRPRSAITAMQLPEQPPPPLAPLWDRVLRARALPPDLDVDLLYIAIRDRLVHPEWEVRLHALRVLADLLPLSGNALSFPFDQVIDNLGHGSPNVRKAALDALKVFCTYCESPDCAARAILDKCSYNNIRPQSANIETKVNVVTGLILSIPSVMGILKRRHPVLDVFPMFEVLGDKLFDPAHKDVAHRSLLKLRRICGPRDYMVHLSRLDEKVQDKFQQLCETYDEDSLDVYYAPRKNTYRDNNQQLVTVNHVFSPTTTPVRISTDSSSEDSFKQFAYYTNHQFGKVILETEIKFDSDTAITMTVLEQNETASDKTTASEDEFDSSDKNMLKYSDEESEDTDVIVKKVRFGGESIKIRTPDSENQTTSEEDNKQDNENDGFKEVEKKTGITEAVTRPASPETVVLSNELKREATSVKEFDSKPPKGNPIELTHEKTEKELNIKSTKKSGIPLPVIHKKPMQNCAEISYTKVKLKSKSLSELYDYFRTKNKDTEEERLVKSGFALTLSEVNSPEKVPSPVEPHKEVEILHNLQSSPVVSPKRKQTRLRLEHDGFVVHLLTSSTPNLNAPSLLSPRTSSTLREHYHWEDLEVVPKNVADQLHNTENWISAVKAADQLHSTLLEDASVAKVEPAAESLVKHMWALSESVPAARAPAEGAVCALLRGASNDCVRNILPDIISRMGRNPLPTALPHALLQRMALHHIVDLVFDPEMIGVESSDPDRLHEAQLRATLCLARAAGPAAVISAVRRRLSGSIQADVFCSKLRERLSRPFENIRPYEVARSSQLPVPVRRRARSTPAPAAPLPPRRLRPLPDSAPLLGSSNASQLSRDQIKRLLSPIPLSDRDSSAFTSYNEEKRQEDRISIESVFGDHCDQTHVDIPADEVDNASNAPKTPPRSPSLKVEDYSEKTNTPSIRSTESRNVEPTDNAPNDVGSQKSINIVNESPVSTRSRKSIQSPIPSKSKSPTISPVKSNSTKSARSGNLTPGPVSDPNYQPVVCERDVRNALSECIIPAKHEDWEVIVNSLLELERLASDPGARAPAASWRAAVRSAAVHVRSLRSKVSRTACSTMGALFEFRGRALDPELEDAATALLERCADVNRFLRADAVLTLSRIAIASNTVRAAVALSRRGATQRAGPVRAAAAQALAKLVEHNGASKMLDMPAEPRTVFLRAAGELLGDASAETRVYARKLCQLLDEDHRFNNMLKEAMPSSRYRAIEKFVDKLRCR